MLFIGNRHEVTAATLSDYQLTVRLTDLIDWTKRLISGWHCCTLEDICWRLSSKQQASVSTSN